MQNQMKIDYEEQMLEIAINDTAAKEYIEKYEKVNVFVRYEHDNGIHYILQINSMGEILTINRIFDEGYEWKI